MWHSVGGQVNVADQHRKALTLPWADVVAQARARHSRRSPELIELQAAARLETRMAAFDVLTPPSPTYRDVVRAIARRDADDVVADAVEWARTHEGESDRPVKTQRRATAR